LIEKLAGLWQVVSLSDVESVIKVMGNPEGFEPDAEDDGSDRAYDSDAGYYTKRLYRDPDDPMVGGVCSGLGYYFGIDPFWIRLAFVLALVFFGTGVFFYIILLIIAPKATTSGEKLYMKGEPVNISSIGKTVEDEIREFGDRFTKEGGAFSRKHGKKLASGLVIQLF
jgi:phage shock protein PspC (stress-responsive transcriptional regulator)